MSNPHAKGRPRLQSGEKAARISVTLPPHLLGLLDQLGLPRSLAVRLALTKFIAAQNKKRK